MKDTDALESNGSSGDQLETLISREWLDVNHLGGYASSTVAGLNTRKYHGLLVAAFSPPVRRMVLLSRVEETVTCDGWSAPLACNEYPNAIYPRGDQSLRAFSYEPFPRWGLPGAGMDDRKKRADHQRAEHGGADLLPLGGRQHNRS